MSKGKLAGITVGCIVAVIVTVVIATGTPTYTLSTSVSPSGAGFVSPPSGEYESDVQVTLTATPASGYAFDRWSGSASGTTSGITITMDSDKSVAANFRAQYSLSTSVSPSGSGTVSPNIGTYDEGTQVKLTAVPASGYTFDHWGGDASGTVNPVTVTVSSKMNVIAYFKLPSWTISAAEAQQAVQDTLRLLVQLTPIEGFPGSQLPNGVEIPKNAKAGTPTLVEIDGIPAWNVPVLSNGVRIGDIHVKQIQSTLNQTEMVNFGVLVTGDGYRRFEFHN